MLTQSKEVQNAWRASQRTLDIKVTIDGKTYGATDINSLKYDSGAYNGDTFAIGSTYSNTVQIEFSHLIEGLKLGMEVHPSIGIKTSSGYVYEPLGVFIISSEIKMDRNNNLTTVSASDRFCGLEGTYVSKLTYPAKVLDVIAEICAQSGVKANTDDLARLPHQADLPAPITGQSYRKALGWIAQLYVGYALFDRQGLFTIRTISEPNYELDPSQYEQAGLTKNEAAYKINGIQCQVTLTTKTRDGESTEETKNYQAGYATGSQIKLENNIMTPQRLNDIWEQLKDITFYPFSLNWFGNPAVEAGDWLRLEDKQGNSFVVPNSSYTLDFNGGLSATSKADQTTSSDQMVPWQGSVAQTIKELQLRRLPDGTVVFPPSVTEPPTNAKFNDVWFKKNGNSTELWIFEKQDDGSGKWVRKDLTEDEIKHQIEQAQAGLNQAKADIINNKQKADQDIENLNKSIEANKKVADQDIQNLNKSIEDNKKVADESLKKLNDSVTNLQGQYDNNIVPDLTKVTNDVADALQKYISAQNNIADLTKQAQAQGKNIADVTNTVKGLNINYANLLGDVNSTKVDVKGMQTTLGNASGDIAQLKLDAQNLQTMLAGKVDNTTYTNFVNLTNQALQAKLTASDLNGYAKTVDLQATANGLQANLNSVTGKLDNLVIGGRNLVRNSGFSKNTDYWNGVERATHDFYYKKKQPLFLIKANTTEERLGSSTYFPLKRNTDYVVSFKGFASENVSSYDIFILARKYGETNSYSSIKHLVDAKRLSGSSVQYVKDLVFNSGENDEAYFRIDNNGSSDGTDAWHFFTEVKVEEGNKSTAWTPAPEDERQRVDNITSQLSARITATSQQFSSYYTKAETDNRTNSAKNDAINSIKNDGNWQGLSNILTNSGFLQTADGFLQKVQQTAQPMIDANNGGGINLVKMSGFHNVTIDQLMPCWNIGNDIFINTKGGRNATGSIVIDARNISDSLREFTQWIDLEPNTDYHLSFHLLFVELAANSSFSAYTYLTEYDDQGNTTYPYRDNGRLIVNTNDRSQNSFTIHTGNTTKKGLLYVRAMKGTKIELEEIKLEKGHIGTPWSPAPSDFATQISFSELSQSLDGLRSTVGSNYGNLQSQISQSSSAVRTELNDRINGVDNKTTSTANSLNSVIGRVGSLENLTNIQIINSAINANDYTNTGNYFIQSASNTNVPGSNWCYLKVEKVNDGRIIQTWQADSDPTLRFIRTKFGDSWTNWQRAASYSEYSELNRTVQGLQSTVSSNYGQLQSQISQSSTAVRTELTDKINGVDSKTTSTANSLNSVIGRVGSLENLTNIRVVNNAINANDYTNTGNYFIQSTDNINVPGTNWCYLKVEKVNDGRIVQTWQADSDPTLRYSRTKLDDSWTQWQRSASYSEYSELNRTVQGLQSTVSSNYGQLQNIISQTDQATQNEINDKVNGLQGQLTLQANEFNVALNNLQVGGTNLVRNSGDFQTMDYWSGTRLSLTKHQFWKNGKENLLCIANSSATQENLLSSSYFDVKPNTTYTISFWVFHDSNLRDYDVYFLGRKYGSPNGFDVVMQLVAGAKASSAYASYVTKQFNTGNSDEGYLRFDNNAALNDGQDTTLYLADIKVEEGDKATAWSPSPYDQVAKDRILAQINMSAGTTLIQNDKIYMDASSTIFSGNAFIPSAAITSLNADKITAGTINGAKVNVINLNANNITAGTLRGSNGEFYLDSGALHVWQNNHDAWIDQNGIHDYDNQRSVWIQKGEINFEHQLGGSMKHTGVILTNSENSNLNGAITIKGDEGFLLSTKNFTTNYWSEQGFSWGTNTAHYVSGSGILGFNNNITVSAGSTDDHSIAALIAGAIPSKNLGNVFGARAQPGVYIYGRNDSNKDHSFVDIKAPASIHLTTLDSYITIGDTTGSERNSDVSINSGNYLTVSADNSINITACSKTKADLMPRISLSEASTSISGDSITLNAKNYVTLLGSSVSVTGDFGVLGKKNAIVPTSRGMAAINAYETAEYYFGDIGETQTNSNGVVTVMIDPYFLETVNTLVPYQVFLTPYGNGNVWVSSRSANNFTVKSSNPNIHFAWEIKAKRKGYENDRMKIVKGVFNNEQY